MIKNDTIIALATPSGIGAIAVIRLSGENAITIVDTFFKSIKKVKKLQNQKSHTIHLGHIINDNDVLDEVLVSVFKNPNSYTGENVVEISCHGSPYIQQEIIQLFLKNGCRMADNGEFTMRAFLNGKMDLSQAEAVADKMKNLKLTIGAKTSTKGKIFGSVNTIQLAESLKDEGFDIDRKDITIKEELIKEVGSYTASVKLHREVIVEIPFDIIAE